MKNSLNIARVKAVYNALEELRDKVVFVGGAIVSLYADREVVEPRPTDDVDVIVEILNYTQRTELEEKLREKGFTHDVESGIVCRYQINGITVDVMPSNDPSIGFNTRWYEEGFKTAISYSIDAHHVIRVLTGPYFIAAKLEAFHDRGSNDGRTSQDFEDIVFILENRSTIWDEMKTADAELKAYLLAEFRKLRSNKNLFEWVDSHVERNEQRSTWIIMDAIHFLIDSES